MYVTQEQSTMDGIQKVEWWDKEDFRGRVNGIYEIGGNGEAVIMPVADDYIVCDFCNRDITVFPVPVTFGHNALCTECYNRYFPK